MVKRARTCNDFVGSLIVDIPATCSGRTNAGKTPTLQTPDNGGTAAPTNRYRINGPLQHYKLTLGGPNSRIQANGPTHSTTFRS